MDHISVKSVLLVDDEPSIREILSVQLEEEGFETIQAEDGIDGLLKLRDLVPQVIISDLQMPRMSGFEFLSVVRQRFPSIRVIVLAGSIPKELPAGIKPDRCFEKSARKIPELIKAVHELALETPNLAAPQPTLPPLVHTRQGGTGYLALPCTDCLRVFHVESPPESKTEGHTGVCPHCSAHIPFLIESTSQA